MLLPEEYIVQKFYEYNGGVKFLRQQKTYNGSCFLCKEGTSWLKKKRCYYLTDTQIVCCHNCGYYSSALDWIKEVSGLTIKEIFKEAKSYDLLPKNFNTPEVAIKAPKRVDKLPHDSINLFDPTQIKFFENNGIVHDALELIKKRKLDIAINKPRALYLSLTDLVHKNRLVIPFYNEANDVVFYQSRAIYEEDLKTRPKYLSKSGGDRTLFNIDQIDENADHIFVLEGPINSFFCENSVAVGGIQEKSYITFLPTQQKQLQRFPLHKKIWVLDSQWIDNASLLKTEKLIELGELVFIWPKDLGQKYKDFNDIAIDLVCTCIKEEMILPHVYTGIDAKLKLLDIKRSTKSNTPLETQKAS